MSEPIQRLADRVIWIVAIGATALFSLKTFADAHRSVGSPSNCTACHADAAQGRFSEHTVRIPQE